MQNTNSAQNTLHAKVSFRKNCGARYIAVSADLYEHNLKPLYFETLALNSSLAQITNVLARLQQRANCVKVSADIKKDVIKFLEKQQQNAC
jgi:hypothetical protein